MVEWVSGFFIPMIEIIFIFGIVGFFLFYIIKGFHNAWAKSWKFFFKYKIGRKSYNEKTLKWCLECMDKGIGWYDAKKIMMVAMVNTNQMNETLWIYDQIISEFNNQKGGKINNGREFKGSNSKIEKQQAELPTTDSKTC